MERQLWRQGFSFVVGVDEAGRGPLAGPVVAAAAVLPRDGGTGLPPHIVLDDSKKMTEEQREEAFEALERAAASSSSRDGSGVAFAACVVPPEMIDEVNILEATMLAMDSAVRQLSSSLLLSGGEGPAASSSAEAPRGAPPPLALSAARPLAVLVDGNRLPPQLAKQMGAEPSSTSKFHARAVVKGDAKCLAIAAASVVAKVTRDRLMREASQKWPEYGFEGHKGYGTAFHRQALLRHGPTPLHRRSFAPIKALLIG